MNVDRFECVNIDIPINSSIKDVFLLVCSHAKSDKKIIVYSKETSLVLDEVELFSDEDGQTYMNYMGKKVVVIDRDEAYREVNPYNASKTVVNYKIQECFMGSKFEANQVGIQGDGACGNNITMLQFSGEYDMKKLAEELQWLILKCREEEINIAPEELEPIITAERAAADGNKEKVRLALKKTGVFLLGFAEKVGAGLVVQAIKHSCGI